MSRPALARTSSAASGLRFCGMIELPVVKASLSATNPNPSLHQSTISSAKRDRWIPASAAAARNSIAKSRSETASSEFAIGRSKPNAAAVASRSIGNEVPASAAAPSGRFVHSPPAIGKPSAVAPDHLDIGHQMVAEGHRLGDLEMGEAGHHRIGFGFGTVEQRLLQVAHHRVDPVDRSAHPQPQIGRDLVVARARGVQASRGRPDQFGEPRLDIDVNVLIRIAEGKAAVFDFCPDLV